ncbi:GNAT family N-acetyltransferase [Jatrophihabitans sp. YIM 134969]
MTTSVDDAALVHPVWSSLTGPHAGFARVRGAARRYPGAVSVLAAVAPDAGPEVWADLRTLQQSDERTVLFGPEPWGAHPPPGWRIDREFHGLQLAAGDDVAGGPDPDAVALGESDVPEMLDLVARTEPGPFGPQTHRMGHFVGIRDARDGRLLAMAGERLHPSGWVEISAVCTDPAARGVGLGRRVIGTVVAGIRDRGDRPFLHAAGTNTGAIRLYEHLGFVATRRMWFTVLA